MNGLKHAIVSYNETKNGVKLTIPSKRLFEIIAEPLKGMQ